jgi:hypothetical protein
MAKNLSAIFRLQGTIEDVTFVNSKAYGLHARARKYSKTPFVMTPPLAKGKDRLQLCNQYAKPVYDALRPEAHDGAAWSRLLKLLRAELKAGRPLGLECLKGFECNLQHPLAEVLPGGYDFSAAKAQNQLRLHVLLHRHPKVEDSMPRTGYQLHVVAIFRDAEHGTAHKAVVLGPLTQYHAVLEPVELTVPLPAAEGPCMLLMGIVPHLQGEGAARIMSDSGMKVVWAADNCTSRLAVPVVDEVVAPAIKETTTRPVHFSVSTTSIPLYQNSTHTAVTAPVMASNEPTKTATDILPDSTNTGISTKKEGIFR